MNRRARILLVDDDEDDKIIFSHALKKVGGDFDFNWAAGGQEALKILTGKEGALPDYVFLDMNMPLMNGKEVLQELKKAGGFSGIRISIYSTSKLNSDAADLRDLGAFCFLTKPPNINDLCSSVRYIIEPAREKYTEAVGKYLSLL